MDFLSFGCFDFITINVFVFYLRKYAILGIHVRSNFHCEAIYVYDSHFSLFRFFKQIFANFVIFESIHISMSFFNAPIVMDINEIIYTL